MNSPRFIASTEDAYVQEEELDGERYIVAHSYRYPRIIGVGETPEKALEELRGNIEALEEYHEQQTKQHG